MTSASHANDPGDHWTRHSGLPVTTASIIEVAIALALKQMGIGPGDTVLVPSYHCASMIEPVIWAGATPLFYRIRLKHPGTGDKWIRPMHHNGHAFVIGEPPAPAIGKPLYRLPELLAETYEKLAPLFEED